MKTLLIVSMFLSLSSVVYSENDAGGPHLYGKGLSSCSTYISTFGDFYAFPNDKKSQSEYLGYIDFVFGYLTAGSIYTKRMLKLNVNKIDMNSAMLYLKKYCTKNPTRSFTDATHDLSIGLTKTF